MKMMKTTLCALVALMTTTAFNAQAVDKADLTVTGTIVPPSCEPTFSSGGLVDYGNIGNNILSPSVVTVLDEKTIDFTIKCTGPSRVAIKTVSTQADSLALVTAGAGTFGNTNISGLIPTDTSLATGLGMSGPDKDKKTGGYAVYVKTADVKIDGDAATGFYTSTDNGNSWSRYTSSSYSARSLGFVAPTISTFGKSTAAVPDTFENMVIPVNVKGFINKTSDLDLGAVITLNGLTTFELVYP